MRYANPAILPLIGYQWILDGKGPNEYQHWIHLSRIVDPRRLDPDVPESLVFRNDPDDGPVLEAAMYMLPPGYNLGNIPADIGWLPGWHVHENLCFENGFELVGVTVNGKCERRCGDHRPADGARVDRRHALRPVRRRRRARAAVPPRALTPPADARPAPTRAPA